MIPTKQRSQHSKKHENNGFIMYQQQSNANHDMNSLPNISRVINNNDKSNLIQHHALASKQQLYHPPTNGTTQRNYMYENKPMVDNKVNGMYGIISEETQQPNYTQQQQQATLKDNLHTIATPTPTPIHTNNDLSYYQRTDMYQSTPSSNSYHTSSLPPPPSHSSSTAFGNHLNDQRHKVKGEEEESQKVYSFMPLETVFQQKRPRRKFHEIERLYQCNYLNCSKAYGTLNHLNAHISMQEHGAKRLPVEFKELRKQLRKTKAEITASHRNSIASTTSSMDNQYNNDRNRDKWKQGYSTAHIQSIQDYAKQQRQQEHHEQAYRYQQQQQLIMQPPPFH